LVVVPRAVTSPCYRTDRLENYPDRYQKVALAIFNTVKSNVGKHAVASPGSYSITASSSDERAGKIIIFQSGLGQERGDDFPTLEDGVYIFIRSNDASAARIWTQDMVDVQFPDLFALMSPDCTLGVAPPCGERFTYFRVNTELASDQLRQHLERIVRLLVRCSAVA
jgi:hypothetical protein